MQPQKEGQVSASTLSAQGILDALTVPVAVLEQRGIIVAVNDAWRALVQANSPGSSDFFVGMSYSEVGERVCGPGQHWVEAATEGIRAVLAGQPQFLLDYACHSQADQRWFQLHVTRLEQGGTAFGFVAHHDITERIQSDQERAALAREAQQHADQLRALADASVSITAAGSPEATLQEITDQARRVIGAHLAATHHVPRGRWNSPSVAVSLSDKYAQFASFNVAPNGTGIYASVARTGRPIRLTGREMLAHEGWRGHGSYTAEHPPLRGLLAVPLKGMLGQGIGVIMVSDKTLGEFTPEDEAILVQLAQIASVCIASALHVQAQHDSAQRLRATQDHANVGIGECDANGRFLDVNSGLTALTGYTRDELLSRTFFELTHPDDAAVEYPMFERQVKGEVPSYTLEKRYLRTDGSILWIVVSASAVFDPNGRFRYAVRVVQDISEQKLAEERQQLLIRELHHRVKNTLATVQALAGSTLRSVSSLEAFRTAFTDRLVSLGRTHSLLTENAWGGAALESLLRLELNPYGSSGERLKLDGPEVYLPAETAVAFGMALHELTTNAAKHGSLSANLGQVEVTWTVEARENERHLLLRWVERNGPPVVPPNRRGFGSQLLQRLLGAQTNGKVEIEYAPEGARVLIEADVSSR